MIELNVSKTKTKIMIDFPINFAFYLILIFVFTKIICSEEILSQNVEARATCGHLKKLFLKKKGHVYCDKDACSDQCCYLSPPV